MKLLNYFHPVNFIGTVFLCLCVGGIFYISLMTSQQAESAEILECVESLWTSGVMKIKF